MHSIEFGVVFFDIFFFALLLNYYVIEVVEIFIYRKTYDFSMVTTIQVSDETKRKLMQIKKESKLSYDKIVSHLLNQQKKLALREQIADYYADYAQEDAQEVNEFIHTETNDETR